MASSHRGDRGPALNNKRAQNARLIARFVLFCTFPHPKIIDCKSVIAIQSVLSVRNAYQSCVAFVCHSLHFA